MNPSPDWQLSAEIVQGYSRRLGNMVLLDPTINGDIGNKDFNTKRSIFTASPLLLTQEVGTYLAWGPGEVDARQKKLADIGLSIWTV